MTTTTTTDTTSTAEAATTATPRFDSYSQIHKAYRALMFDTLSSVGRMDVYDASDRARTLAQVERLLAHMDSHLHHENDFLHAALEARRPGAAAVTARAHEEHADSIAALAAEVAELHQAPPAQAARVAQRLYRHLALFVAENLEHMQVEETVNNSALWGLYSDAELAAIHGRLVVDLDPTILTEALEWMTRASHPQELAAMLGGMRAGMPAAPFREVLSLVRAQLDDHRWLKLERALAPPPEPSW